MPFSNRKISPPETPFSAAQTFWRQAEIFISQDRYDLAEAPLRKVLGAEPDHASAPAALAMALIRQYRIKEAVEQARDAVRLRPEYAFAHHTLAFALACCEEFEESVKHARESLRLKPNIAMYHRVAPGVLLQLERFEEAIQEAERGLAIKADDPILQRVRALALASAGRVEDAKLAVAELLRVSPGDARTLMCAGSAYRRMKDYATAEDFYRKTLEQNPRIPSGHGGLGLVRYEQGQWAEAKPLLEEATRLMKGDIDPEVRRALAAIAAREGLGDAGV